jgi:hypothetical protein
LKLAKVPTRSSDEDKKLLLIITKIVCIVNLKMLTAFKERKDKTIIMFCIIFMLCVTCLINKLEATYYNTIQFTNLRDILFKTKGC